MRALDGNPQASEQIWKRLYNSGNKKVRDLIKDLPKGSLTLAQLGVMESQMRIAAAELQGGMSVASKYSACVACVATDPDPGGVGWSIWSSGHKVDKFLWPTLLYMRHIEIVAQCKKEQGSCSVYAEKIKSDGSTTFVRCN